jgi:ADP-ribose pyrophosphatase YjhB (NUDIX family)
MTPENAHAWLEWAMRLQALAQDGLLFAQNPFDVERYGAVRQIAAKMMAAGSGWPTERVAGIFDGETGYATPKVDVRGVVLQEGRMLLVRERTDGRWTLPGGWADPGDTPSAAVEREIREESGYLARAVKLLAVYDRARQGHQPPHPFAIYKLFFLCELTGGQAQESDETDGVGFFGRDALPELSLARVTPRQLVRLFEHARHPEWPADFD